MHVNTDCLSPVHEQLIEYSIVNISTIDIIICMYTTHPNFQLTTATIMITIIMMTANAAATGPITTFISSVDDEDTGAALALAVASHYHTNNYISNGSYS